MTIIKLLRKEVEDFNLLSEEQQEHLAAREYSKALLTQITSLDALFLKLQQALTRNTNFIKKFIHAIGVGKNSENQLLVSFSMKKKRALDEWNQRFQDDSSMTHLKKEIQLRKRVIQQEKIDELSKKFPLLTYSKRKGEQAFIEQLKTADLTKESGAVLKLSKLDEKYLADAIFYCMHAVTTRELSFVNINIFNKQQAQLMANAMREAFEQIVNFNYDGWFAQYESNLRAAIKEQLLLIQGKDWQVKALNAGNNALDSLSFLWNNVLVSNVDSFLGKMANAHAFIQATSFSTQNESSYLAILDIYNYKRHYESISEAQTVLANLFSPFAPLYYEYKDIALYEKNVYWKSIRSMTPIMILVAFILLVAVILAPLALPELAFITAFIPALFMGLGLATKYVSVKNELYKVCRELYYGGPFAIPEFQVNERMITAFKTSELAEKIREFYINALAQCDQIESDYQGKDAGILTEKELAHRKENLKQRHSLALEWYDIHSNTTLGCDQAPKIVVNRLHKLNDCDYVYLKQKVQEAQNSIAQLAAQISKDIKTTILKHNAKPANNAQPIEAVYRFQFFRPVDALAIKNQMNLVANFSDEVSNTVAKPN